MYKKLFTYLLLVLGLLLVVNSCKKEEATPPDGSDKRDKFLNTWICDEFSSITGSNPAFNVFIVKSTSNGGQVLIENFYGLGNSARAIADVVKDSLYIYPQIVSGNTVQGSGTLKNTTTIQLKYTVYDGSTNDNVTATLTR